MVLWTTLLWKEGPIVDAVSPIYGAGSAAGRPFVFRVTPVERREAQAALQQSAGTGSKALQLIYAAVAIEPGAEEHTLDVQA